MDGSDDGWLGRGDAGALGVVAAGREGADQALVPAGAHGGLRGSVPRCSARAGAAQDRLDAGGGGGGSGAGASAGAAWPGAGGGGGLGDGGGGYAGGTPSV